MRCDSIERATPDSARVQPFPTKWARLAPVQPVFQKIFVEYIKKKKTHVTRSSERKKIQLHARMFAGRSQDTLIVSFELRHANRTLFHGHAEQGHLQLDTPIPRHPPPHELDLAHEIRRIHIPVVPITLWGRDIGRRWRCSGPKEVRNK